jgi:hypothetical protein
LELEYEPGYIPGDEAECAELRAALFEDSASIIASRGAATASDPRLPLEAGLTARLLTFVERQCYRLSGWAGEDGIHFTGELGGGSTHGWVRVWYSPEVVSWLDAGRPEGQVPDEAILIKERFEPLTEPQGDEAVFKLMGWQPMVRRPDDSRDGWFWGDISQEEARHGELMCSRPPLSWSQEDTLRLDDCRPPSRFGQPCLRCHASASDFTYSQTAHLPEVTGGTRAKDQVIYDYRRVWRDVDAEDAANHYADYKNKPPSTFIAEHPDRDALVPALPAADPAFVAQHGLPADEDAPYEDIPRFFDHVVSKAGGDPDTFLTSDQCGACHSGVAHITEGIDSHGSMLARDGDLEGGSPRYADVSPYGEWSVSMMALSGRDPIFRAQREWEANHRSDCADEITDLCYKCHGAAGQRQLQLDAPGRVFDHAIIFELPDAPDGKYGSLARDGITCTVCHQMSGKGLGKPASYTGNWTPTAPSDVQGPYADDVHVDPMKRALGKTPSGEGGRAEVMKSAALCGSCHAAKLPVRKVGSCTDEGFVYEQATFLEWRNSNYRKNDAFITDEGKDGATPVTCQGCHMPKEIGGKDLVKKIASIEDAEFPTASLEGVDDVHEGVDIEPRKPFSRHQLNGINLFALSMFAQAPRVFGLADFDYMSNQYGEPTRLQIATAIAAGRAFADTAAKLSIGELNVVTDADSTSWLEFSVKVTNKAGHKLPSGVAFRRAFLEVAIEDALGNALWASGRTNESGVILGSGGQVLASEFSETTPEPHHEVISSEDEVQIYEERVTDSDGKLTTSFLSIYDSVKDNRLLPAGWKANFAPTMENGKVPDGLEPHGVGTDPQYPDNGTPACGCDVVKYRVPLAAVPGFARARARLHYQSIPPYYLRDRFSVSLPDAKRLYQIASHLDTGPKSAVPSWKLTLTEAVRDFP